MCTQKRIFDHLMNRYGIPADLLMTDLHLCSCEFFLDLWGRSLWGPLIRALRLPVRLRHFVWISPICGSAIVRRSSRSPQGFGASLPVAWSHPTLAGIKLFTCCSQQSYPCSWTYYHEDRAILVLVYIGTYHVVIRAIVVTVGFVITHLSTLCLPSIAVFIHHIYLFCHIL